MKRRYKIVDNEGNLATVTVSFENGTYLEIEEFSSFETVESIIEVLDFHDINCRIEVIK